MATAEEISNLERALNELASEMKIVLQEWKYRFVDKRGISNEPDVQ